MKIKIAKCTENLHSVYASFIPQIGDAVTHNGLTYEVLSRGPGYLGEKKGEGDFCFAQLNLLRVHGACPSDCKVEFVSKKQVAHRAWK